MTRRRALLQFTLAGSALAGSGVARSSDTVESSAARRTLKDVVLTPTVDVEVHVSDAELYVDRQVPDRRDVTEADLDKQMARREWQPDMPDYQRNRARFKDYRSRTSIDLRTEFMMREFDQAGLDIAVHQVVDHSVKPSSIGRHYQAGFVRMLEDAVRVREQYPARIMQMVGIDPRSGSADALARFETAVKDYGFKGLGEIVLQQFKVYPHDRRLYPLYERCVEWGLPFLGNCEGPAPFTMPGEFEQVARDFPDLKICLAGSGRPRAAEASQAPVQAAIRLAAEYENVYLNTADWQRRSDNGIAFFLQFLRACFDSDARTKVMYASDFPVMTAMYHPADWIDVLLNQADANGYAFSDEEITRFFSTNALDYLAGVR